MCVVIPHVGEWLAATGCQIFAVSNSGTAYDCSLASRTSLIFISLAGYWPCQIASRISFCLVLTVWLVSLMCICSIMYWFVSARILKPPWLVYFWWSSVKQILGGSPHGCETCHDFHFAWETFILKLDKAGLKQSQIPDDIFKLDGVFISRVTIIAYRIRRGREGGTLEDLPRRHIEPKFDAMHLDFIEILMQENNETTAMEICAKL